MEGGQEKRMKILCLHGFRTSGKFLQKQISKWDPSIFSEFDMVFPDGIFPAGGKSEIEGIFPPPYCEWFQFNPVKASFYFHGLKYRYARYVRIGVSGISGVSVFYNCFFFSKNISGVGFRLAYPLKVPKFQNTPYLSFQKTNDTIRYAPSKF
uniref:Serine hydrolase domain-containing protein n=1 Tax=Nelumbo nucifera TaxID=4432 RepID=A0A822ZIC9_NELNU|nr:TPA_asm: hypothetical protein HUJ06_001349 [Nelumbo nucifera]